MPHDSGGRPRIVAFFLPQFHPIPENDRWWGEGFTEWTNVKKAEPLFQGHDHPRVPLDDDYFDLTDLEVVKNQCALAQQHGIDGLCIYFYWFNGHRLLEKPLDLIANHVPTMPYMLSWANENWSRRWDGRESEVLMHQNYDTRTAQEIFADFLPHFQRDHYLRSSQGAPMLMVHRTDLLPNPREYAQTWRDLARRAGLPGLHLIAAETRQAIDPTRWGFDAVAEFPPLTRGRLGASVFRPPAGLSPDFNGRMLSYRRVMQESVQRSSPAHTLYRGVMPSWDNTARRGPAATVVLDHSPAAYHQWLTWALDQEAAEKGKDGIVFINAWNEWAEAAYLQPDTTFGDEYLRATLAASRGEAFAPRIMHTAGPRERSFRGLNAGYVRSIMNAAAASSLGIARRVRGRLHG